MTGFMTDIIKSEEPAQPSATEVETENVLPQHVEKTVRIYIGN